MGTDHGLSQYPYIRESRRIVAHKTVVEEDVLAAHQPGARAAFCGDSVGLGWYPVDIHGVPGDVAATGPTRPFQIPLGALIPRDADNLLPACKDLGVTHITNGCYRLHPVEWNIGEAAGALASLCLRRGCRPTSVLERDELLRELQRELLAVGVPLYWCVDVPPDHDAFADLQSLAVESVWEGEEDDLCFHPEEPVDEATRQRVLDAAGLTADQVGSAHRSRSDLARIVARLRRRRSA
jgi:hypothetical protein